MWSGALAPTESRHGKPSGELAVALFGMSSGRSRQLMSPDHTRGSERPGALADARRARCARKSAIASPRPNPRICCCRSGQPSPAALSLAPRSECVQPRGPHDLSQPTLADGCSQFAWERDWPGICSRDLAYASSLLVGAPHKITRSASRQSTLSRPRSAELSPLSANSPKAKLAWKRESTEAEKWRNFGLNARGHRDQ